MGTTSCQMTIISWIFFLSFYKRQKFIIWFWHLFWVVCWRKVCYFCLRKESWALATKNCVHSNYLISMFFLHASWWKGMGCQCCNFSVFHLVQKKHPVFALSSPAWVYMASEFCPWGTEITHFSICCSPTSVLSAGIMAPMHLHWK